MRIGDRYLNRDMMFKAVIIIGGAIALFIWPSLEPMGFIAFTLFLIPSEIWDIFHARCPNCKKFFTAKTLGSEPLEEGKWVAKERVTYSRVNCGEKWTRDKRRGTWSVEIF